MNLTAVHKKGSSISLKWNINYRIQNERRLITGDANQANQKNILAATDKRNYWTENIIVSESYINPNHKMQESKKSQVSSKRLPK